MTWRETGDAIRIGLPRERREPMTRGVLPAAFVRVAPPPPNPRTLENNTRANRKPSACTPPTLYHAAGRRPTSIAAVAIVLSQRSFSSGFLARKMWSSSLSLLHSLKAFFTLTLKSSSRPSTASRTS
ncbi:hypothetical protein EYF80_042001 [Liparis tanakae]|uniref:Uncharacterized protein n=1 Tax=Liparis tanakae TaxID=230148 RepID=A0A4Z2G4T8_9TELE|nr:hypothetical protein EYF80_042001 [Liparis tanakae]